MSVAVLVFLALVSSSVSPSKSECAIHVAAGERYLTDLHTRACLELDAAKIASHVSQDKLVCELADPRMTFLLPLLEHTSYAAITTRFEKERARLLRIIGERRENTFVWKKKGDSPGGLFQITMGALSNMRRAYPSANLPRSYKACMADHVCGAKVQILILDAFSAYLDHRISVRMRSALRPKTLAHARYLASSYNAGMVAPRLVLQSRGSPHWPHKLPLPRMRNYVRMLEIFFEDFDTRKPTT